MKTWVKSFCFVFVRHVRCVWRRGEKGGGGVTEKRRGWVRRRKRRVKRVGERKTNM